MAFVAGDARRRVLRVGKAFLFLAGNVAGQAAFRVFLGTGVECEDQLGASHFLGRVASRFLFGVRMGFAGAVAGLTSRYVSGRCSCYGLFTCRRLPFQRYHVIHEIVNLVVGRVGWQYRHNGASAALDHPVHQFRPRAAYPNIVKSPAALSTLASNRVAARAHHFVKDSLSRRRRSGHSRRGRSG